jgi:hypothetical protein
LIERPIVVTLFVGLEARRGREGSSIPGDYPGNTVSQK